MIVSPCGVTKCVKKEKAFIPVSGMQGILSKCCYWFLYIAVFPWDALLSLSYTSRTEAQRGKNSGPGPSRDLLADEEDV